MNYNALYIRIVTRGLKTNAARKRARKLGESYENHHILPMKAGGKNVNANKVLLTPREHFICHILLVKMTTGQTKWIMSTGAAILHNRSGKRYCNQLLYTRLINDMRRGPYHSAYNDVRSNPFFKLRIYSDLISSFVLLNCDPGVLKMLPHAALFTFLFT